MKLRIFSALLATIGLSARTVDGVSAEPRTVEENEASSNFELNDIGPLFVSIGKLFERGIGDREVSKIVKIARNLEVEEEADERFEIVYQGKSAEILVRIFMDDIDSPDVFVFASKPITDVVQSKMDEYSERRGR